MSTSAIQTPSELLQTWRTRLDCRLSAVVAVQDDCLRGAALVLTPAGMEAYVELACALGRMGRGAKPVLALLQEWPPTAQIVGEDVLADVAVLLHAMQKSPNSEAMAGLLDTLPAVARRLQGADPLRHYLRVLRDVMSGTSVSIHGHHATFASPGLPVLMEHAPRILDVLTVAGLARWANYGIRHYQHHPDRQRDYFALASADSRAVLQRERHGTLLADVESQLAHTQRALWTTAARPGDLHLHAFSTGLNDTAPLAPWLDETGLFLPDVYDTLHGVGGLDRYRVAMAHLSAHRRWGGRLMADNLSPMQRLTVETWEDARIDTLLLRQYPGLRPCVLALHPIPIEDACDASVASCLRHRLAMFSRAVLDPEHGYTDLALLEFVDVFRAEMAKGESHTDSIANLALRYAARTRRQSDQQARVFFENTVVSYRDDNRHLWQFIEEGDEEESFDDKRQPPPQEQLEGLPPRLYPEWDAATQTYRPDWVSVYEALHPSGDARVVDALLAQHAGLARQLQAMLDRLTPQDRQRIRFQEEGSELDLDVALRSLIDWRAGAQPDPRILMSHRTCDRSIAVMVLLDLSESLNDEVPGTGQTCLSLSQQAVALLGWAIDRLGDPFAITGFHSNTRHDVRYTHIKGFGEAWDDTPKARLAALQARFSTRMGAALRHASRTLRNQKADKKLLLILTDGRPTDVDVPDESVLIADTRQAVQELAQQGMLSHCISLDPQADAYVNDIFGQHATVVDRIEQLPERLTKLFVSLTR